MKTKKLVVAILTLLLSLVLVACKKEMTSEERLAAVFEPENFEKLVSNHSATLVAKISGEDEQTFHAMYKGNLVYVFNDEFQVYFEVIGDDVWSYYIEDDIWYKEKNGHNLEVYLDYGRLIADLDKDFFVYNSEHDIFVMDENGLLAYIKKRNIDEGIIDHLSIAIENNQISRLEYSANFGAGDDRATIDVSITFFDYGQTDFTLPEAQVI